MREDRAENLWDGEGGLPPLEVGDRGTWGVAARVCAAMEGCYEI
jgi:hypothetical protein